MFFSIQKTLSSLFGTPCCFCFLDMNFSLYDQLNLKFSDEIPYSKPEVIRNNYTESEPIP